MIWTRLERYGGARLMHFEGDAGLNWEPVKLLKNRGDVVNGGWLNSEPDEVYVESCEEDQREVSFDNLNKWEVTRL